MKAAIVTFSNSNNYGANLQMYAMQTYLKSIGFEVEFVDYRFLKKNRGIRKYIGKGFENTRIKWSQVIADRVFKRFRKRHFSMSEKYDSYEQLEAECPEADVYICGSDQIWNPVYVYDLDDVRVFYLEFAKNVRKVSYAASVGLANIEKSVAQMILEKTSCFERIGIREMETVLQLKKYGVNSFWTPDPTILLRRDEYLRLGIDDSAKDRVFYYLLNENNIRVAEQILGKVCDKLNSRVSRISNIGTFRRMFSEIKGVEDWVCRLQNCSYVVTNSFHATVFSLIFNKKFVVVARTGETKETNVRLTSLLTEVGLLNRIIYDFDEMEVEKLLDFEIDWMRVNRVLGEWRSVGRIFFKDIFYESKRSD